jgi:hypothetical protein
MRKAIEKAEYMKHCFHDPCLSEPKAGLRAEDASGSKADRDGAERNRGTAEGPGKPTDLW